MPLGKRTDLGNARFAGIDLPFCCDIVDTIKNACGAQENGFDFVVVPLVHPRFRRSSEPGKNHILQQQPFTRSDLLLTSSQWAGQVVGSVSPWIDADSESEGVRKDSSVALKQELDWAYHLGLQAVTIPSRPMRTNSFANTAMIIHQALEGALGTMAFWVKLPLALEPEFTASQQENGCDENTVTAHPEFGGVDPWEWWNGVRCLSHHHSLLGLVLELPESLPPKPMIERYLGENVKAVIVPTKVFTTNRKGFPALSKRHQEVIEMFLRQNVQLILSGPNLHGAQSDSSAVGNGVRVIDGHPEAVPRESGPLKVYWEYLSFLFRRLTASSDQELLELHYRDHLQVPLEPLRHNLESQTYEVFERDGIKYETYREAVYEALKDWPTVLGQEQTPIVLMVVGAGRGPLVHASLQASRKSGRPLKIYAVEKNPNAVVTLQNRVIDEGWGDVVTVVPADMRNWEAPEKADILVSELLGSFGDNELSPECLDGAQRFLKEGGISIPSSYTSYCAPVTAFKAYNSARGYNDVKHMETGYVVKLHNHVLLAPPQPVFTFSHPNRADFIDNSRYKKLTFSRPEDSPAVVMHGFVGYFETVLYKHVKLSTVPETHTPDMGSWFPILFPIAEPLDIRKGKTDIVLHIWRCMAEHKVWYEWSFTSPVVTPVHNPNGRSHWVGL